MRHVPDRKSTRLNSSHLGISYAVFCLKKKKAQDITQAAGLERDTVRQRVMMARGSTSTNRSWGGPTALAVLRGPLGSSPFFFFNAGRPRRILLSSLHGPSLV